MTIHPHESVAVPDRPNPLLRAVRQHPIVTFVIISYVVAWGFVPFGSFGAFGPLVAALVVIPATQGWPGLRDLGSHLLRWRVGWRWYAWAIAVPLAVFAISISVNVATGAPAPSMTSLAPWYSVLWVFALRLVNPLDGALGEEPGWRGYLQPSLQRNHSRLTATVIAATIVAVWHVPLILLPHFDLPPVGFIVATFAITFWYSWLYNRSGGSVLMTLIAHALQGSVQPWTFWADAASSTRVVLLDYGTWTLIAIALVALDWKFWRARSTADQTPAGTRSTRWADTTTR